MRGSGGDKPEPGGLPGDRRERRSSAWRPSVSPSPGAGAGSAESCQPSTCFTSNEWAVPGCQTPRRGRPETPPPAHLPRPERRHTRRGLGRRAGNTLAYVSGGTRSTNGHRRGKDRTVRGLSPLRNASTARTHTHARRHLCVHAGTRMHRRFCTHTSMFVLAHVHTHQHLCVYTHTHSHIGTCACTCTHAVDTCVCARGTHARRRTHAPTRTLVHAHTYVCTYPHRWLSLHTHAHVNTRACAHAHIHMCAHLRAHVHLCVHMYTHQHLCVCVYTQAHQHSCVHMCTHVHTATCHTWTFVFAHVHTHQHLCVCMHVLTLACARTCTCWHLYTHVCTDFLSSSTHYCRLPWSTACLGNSKVCFALLGITEHPHLLRTGSPFRLSLPATLVLATAEHATCVHGVRAGSDL